MKNKINDKSIDWGIPVGLVLGVIALGYIYIQKENIGEFVAFKFVFFPMLATIGVAAIENLVFWMATGYSPRKPSSGSPTNEELLSKAVQSSGRVWLVMCYRFLQPVTMIGAGYISICPVIGIFLLK